MRFSDRFAQFGSGNQYSYFHEEDETTFSLVDNTRVQKPLYQRGRFARQNRRGGHRNTLQMQALGKLNKTKDRDRNKAQAKRWGRNNRNAPIKMKDASVTVKSDWVTIEDMDFPRLSKLSLPGKTPLNFQFLFK